MEFFSSIKMLGSSLIPPNVGDTDGQRRWQITMAACVVVLCGSMVLHIAMACGMIPSVFDGFARSAEVQSLANDVNTIVVLQMGSELRQDQADRCHASDDNTKLRLSAQIDKIEQYYVKRTKVAYILPLCSDL